ncbi:uncharacterized protein GIQ15_04693 [Arthroderma uncinatum]|uniref:uncharacterized protein n=1 Tax=Arthroderma uncinatum TaxID=74035 RepID=UPI00144AC418|nr:uncharacterized protein GIQ15_04693 [Arthroderma uncinatum]KAF3481934.1 hypothetical protein GIQ15_04693 [Arthroderma uncinatum]
MAKEVSSYCGSPYLAELYELQWARPNMPDVELYTKVLIDAVSKHREAASDRQFTFLEIGTGSGRVMLGILKRLAAASFNTSNIEMIGLDYMQVMLDLAVKLESKESGLSPPVTWVLGDALAMEKLPVLSPRAGKDVTVDLLLFPFSSIVHMVEDGQLEQLFLQIGKVLTPGTGRAYISLLNWFFIRPGDDLKARVETEVLPPPTDVQSEEFPGIRYYSETKKSEYMGKQVAYRADVQIFKREDDGQEKEIESYRIKQTLRWFSEAAIMAAIEAAGLKLLETTMVGLDMEGVDADYQENIFVLQRV